MSLHLAAVAALYRLDAAQLSHDKLKQSMLEKLCSGGLKVRDIGCNGSLSAGAPPPKSRAATLRPACAIECLEILTSIVLLIGMCCPSSAAHLVDGMISAQYNISSAGFSAKLFVHGRLDLRDHILTLGIPFFPGLSKLVGPEHDDYTVITENPQNVIGKIEIIDAKVDMPVKMLRFASKSPRVSSCHCTQPSEMATKSILRLRRSIAAYQPAT